MRILQVNHGYPPEGIGGTECYVEAISRGLSARGHTLHAFVGSIEVRDVGTVEVEVAGPADRAVEVARVHRGDLFFDRWDKAYHPQVDRWFREHLRHRRPDVVHCHQWMRLTSNLCAIAVELRIPVVVTLHEFHVTCPRVFRTRPDWALCDAKVSLQSCGDCVERWPFQGDDVIERALGEYDAAFRHELACAGRILAPSRSHATAVAAHLDEPGLDIEVLPHGRPTEVQPAPRNHGDKLRFVCPGQLFRHKGAGLLLEAFRAMRWRHAVELHILGGEPDPAFAAELRALADGLAVTFHGAYRVEELSNLAMDLVVLPTLVPETWCFVLDEAAGLGVPVLAADVGAIPERATPFVRLFRRGDVGSLRDAMDQLAAAPQQLAAMRDAEPVRTYPMSQHLDALETIYRDVIEAGPGAVDGGRALHHDQAEWAARESRLRRFIAENRPGDGA